ncbi:MAG: hypothetical protein ACPGVG_10255 [Mycobacterium sp.]
MRRARGSVGSRHWAHFGVGAYALASEATAQAFEDLTNDNAADWSVVTVFEADPGLGDESTYRVVWSASGDDDTNGSFMIATRVNPTGELRQFARSDAGTDLIGQPNGTTNVVFDGTRRLLQHYDASLGSGNARHRAKRDSDAVDTLDATYSRAGLGVIDLYSPAGSVLGPDPVVSSALGWVYMHALVPADLESVGAAIQAAYAAESDLYAACNAVIDEIAATATPTYAQVFAQGVAARYGDDATIVGATYTLPGVSP